MRWCGSTRPARGPGWTRSELKTFPRRVLSSKRSPMNAAVSSHSKATVGSTSCDWGCVRPLPRNGLQARCAQSAVSHSAKPDRDRERQDDTLAESRLLIVKIQSCFNHEKSDSYMHPVGPRGACRVVLDRRYPRSRRRTTSGRGAHGHARRRRGDPRMGDSRRVEPTDYIVFYTDEESQTVTLRTGRRKPVCRRQTDQRHLL